MKRKLIIVALLSFVLGVVSTIFVFRNDIFHSVDETDTTETETDEITVESETETEKITESAKPETTKAPETTVAPDTTIAPETTVTTDTTVAPETTIAPDTTVTAETTVSPETTVAPDTTASPETTIPPETTAPEPTLDPTDISTLPAVPEGFFASSLFIGDSRTVGLSCYADLGGATVFATKGMNVFRVFKDEVEVPRYGPSDLANVLKLKKYDKIYLMLGLNEIGFSTNPVLTKYAELIAYIHENQPEAKIYLQANLHVTASRSNTDAVYNNTRMNELNAQIESFANGTNIFYIDANILFDDATGGLCAEYVVDDFHLKRDYYPYWVRWIAYKSAALLATATQTAQPVN